MRYAPPKKCLNDFHIIKLNNEYHLIHLQGRFTYPFDATKLETSYGHAISTDLIKWRTKDPVFRISPPPNFDDSAIWTMHVIWYENKFWLFYTGLNKRVYFQQKIGLAFSEGKNIEKWIRYKDNPILLADSRYYQVDNDMAWRDPFVIYDKKSKEWLMYIAAKHNDGPKRKRGCIGLAVSKNLLNWKIQPPVLAPRQFFEMECPAIYYMNKAYYMLVSVSDDNRVRAYRAEDPKGPFKLLGIITCPNNYAPRLIRNKNKEWLLLHTVKRRWGFKDSGPLIRGMIAQPKLIKFDEDGVPYLIWYSQNEKYLNKEHEKRGSDGLISIDIPEKYTHININLRVNQEGTNKKGVELIIDKKILEMRYIEDKKKLQRISIDNLNSIKNLKVLMFKEYYEIYLNNRLILTPIAYRHCKGSFNVIIDEKLVKFSFQNFENI